MSTPTTTSFSKVWACCFVFVTIVILHYVLQKSSVPQEPAIREHLNENKMFAKSESQSQDKTALILQRAQKHRPYLRKPDCTTSQKYGCLEAWLRHDGKQVSCTLLKKDITRTARWFSVFNTLTPDADSEFSMTLAWLKPEMPSAVDAPKNIPEMYKQRFTLNGRVPVHPRYFNQVYLGSKALSADWTEDYVNDFVRRAAKKEMFTYKKETTQVYQAIEKYKSYVEGNLGIVVGSETPWVEAILLQNGAGHVLTLEFGEILSTHPQVSTMVPREFTEAFLNRQLKTFDFGISFSSLEHDGLGRYGDVLNPEGDLQTMTRMRSVIKPGGIFFLGVPVDNDAVVFNAHRFYGRLRIPKLTAGWKLIDVIGTTRQEVMVLQNLNGCSNK